MSKINYPKDEQICKECGGFCCHSRLRRVPLKDLATKPDFKHYFEVRSNNNYKIIGDYVYYILPFPCSHLIETGCDLGELKPQTCKDFPPHWDDDHSHFCKLMEKIYRVEGTIKNGNI